MQKGSSSASGEQSWRTLSGRGNRRKRILSPQARKRRLIQVAKLLLVLTVVCLVIGGAGWGVYTFFTRDEPIQIAPPSKPIEKILFDTDGVLPNSWLGTVLDLQLGVTLMEADIYKMKEKLEAHGQVKSASVEREFPNALKIQLKEREPVLRMRVEGKAGGAPETRIVSRDGTLYQGVGYPKATLRQLPFVVPYQHPEGGIFPMHGIDVVADLLEVTRRTQPNFFKTLQLVSLKYFSGNAEMPGQVIEVQTSMVPRIIFGTNIDFAQQLDRLGVILQYVQSHGNPAVKRIDLSLQGSAAVQFESGRISTF